MAVLHKKLLRDLWRLRGQTLAIAAVVGSGVAVLVMSLSTHVALTDTTNAYYERYRFAHVFARAVRAPESVAQRMREIPGVQTVETRIVRSALLEVAGFHEPVVGRMTSIPETGQPLLNQLVLRSGRWIEPEREDEVILGEPFAEAHELVAGDTLVALLNGRRRELTVVGTALSPEAVYALAPGALMPDDERFGILWMGREALAATFDLDGAFDDASLALLRGTPEAGVVAEVDRLLEPYGGVGAVGRADQLSNWFVQNELDQLETMSTILPGLFLAVAVFLTNTVLGRLITTERSEIGLLKAFGYGRLRIGWHYAELAIAIALVGVLLGWSLGALAGVYNTRQYAEVFRFPLLVYRPGFGPFALGALFSCAACLLGALGAVRRVALLPPAEAMRPPAPTVFRRGRLHRTLRLPRLDQPTRIALRQIARWPVRAGFTTVGIALSGGLLIMALQWTDSIDRIADAFFREGRRQSLTVGLFEARERDIVREFERLEGVLRAEPQRSVPADFRAGSRAHRGGVIGLEASSVLQPIRDDVRSRDLEVPPFGLVLGTQLAEKLGVRPGDPVHVDVLVGRRPSVDLPVVEVVDTLIGMPAYMELGALNRLLREEARVDSVDLLVDPLREPALLSELAGMPRVGSVLRKQAAIDSFYANISEHLLVFIGMFVLFAGSLGFGVAYNSTRIALSERGRELATLRVLGFTKGEISYVLLCETALLVVLALPQACLAGLALVLVMSRAFATELFRMPLVLEPSTYGTALVFLLIATGSSAAVVRRRIDHLDLIRVLKTRE